VEPADVSGHSAALAGLVALGRYWDAEWSDERKRAATAQAIATHRRKGSVTVVREALAAIDTLARLIEWHEASPRLTPHTAQIRLPVVDAEGVAGGTRCSAATTAQILADVTRVAPVRTHFEVVLDLGSATAVPCAGPDRLRSTVGRAPAGSIPAASWAALITDEIGEPLTDDAGLTLQGDA
jgi:phage tail P2-like protein